MAQRRQSTADDAGSRPLWFNPPAGKENRRRTLTREHVVAEALTIIGADGVDALSMRALATRLGVVPAALYRHVRNKEQLHDLVLDGVLAEVDCQVDHRLAWAERVKVLAHRLRTVLEAHPGIAGLLKTRDPLGPHSLALAEAFLAALHAGGLPGRDTGLAFCLVYDYALGFALSGPTSINEQRVQDTATRNQLHAFLRSLPADRFPTLVALGEHVWLNNRNERFAAGLNTLIAGLETAQRPRPHGAGRQPQRRPEPRGNTTSPPHGASRAVRGRDPRQIRDGQHCDGVVADHYGQIFGESFEFDLTTPAPPVSSMSSPSWRVGWVPPARGWVSKRPGTTHQALAPTLRGKGSTSWS